MLKLTKRVFIAFNIAIKYNFPVFAFLISFICLMKGRTLLQNIFITISWSLRFSYVTYTTTCIVFWQMIYFCIICYYLKLKLIAINNQIKQKVKNIEIPRSFSKGLIKLHKIYAEIYDYNKFWSKIIAVYYSESILFICAVINGVIFGEMPFILRFISIYFISAVFIMISILILSAATIDTQSKITYKLLNKFYLIFRPNRIISYIEVKL